MTFERFTPGLIASDEGRNDDLPANPVDERDPRIEEVHAAIDWLEQMQRPAVLSERQWFDLLRDLRHVADNWLDLALACGWDVMDLFGSPPQLNGRSGLMGVAMLLRGRQLESITSDEIVIVNRLGPPNVFRRQPGVVRTGQALVWEIAAAGCEP